MAKQITDKLLRGLVSKGDREDITDTIVPALQIRNYSNRVIFSVRYRIRGHGKQRRKRLGEYPDMKLQEARAEARSLLARAAMGEDPEGPGEGFKVSELIDQYLEVCERRRDQGELADKTVKEYRRMLEKDAKPALGDAEVAAIRPPHVARLLDDVAKRGPIAANRLRLVLSGAFSYAVEIGVPGVWSNPASATKPPAREVVRKRVLVDDEIRWLWRALDSSASELMRASVRLLLLTAQRRESVSSMRWDEIHEDSTGAWWVFDHKSDTGHWVYLSEDARRVLDRLPHKSEWVFPGRAIDGPMHPDSISTFVRELRLEGGVKRWTPHDLRRTASTSMVRLGVDAAIVDAILGHRKPGMRKVYNQHAYLEEAKEALALWGGHVRGLVGGKL